MATLHFFTFKHKTLMCINTESNAGEIVKVIRKYVLFRSFRGYFVNIYFEIAKIYVSNYPLINIFYLTEKRMIYDLCKINVLYKLISKL